MAKNLFIVLSGGALCSAGMMTVEVEAIITFPRRKCDS
jgi:hypothetical protein